MRYSVLFEDDETNTTSDNADNDTGGGIKSGLKWAGIGVLGGMGAVAGGIAAKKMIYNPIRNQINPSSEYLLAKNAKARIRADTTALNQQSSIRNQLLKNGQTPGEYTPYV